MIELELMPNGQSGVYAIKHNVLGGRAYVGSSVNMRSGLLSHRSNLRRGRHPSRELQVHGTCTVNRRLYMKLEYVPETALSSRENYWLDAMRADGGCFNRSSAGRHITMEVA